MSARYGLPKIWTRESALQAISVEEECAALYEKVPSLVLRFPDPELNREIVSSYSPDISNVYFLHSSASRYCTVRLRPDADVQKVIDTISKIPFGTGFVSAEPKTNLVMKPTSKPEHVDPYTLYVGNLSDTITRNTLRDHFPNSTRIDIGFAVRMRRTRYAFIRFANTDDAIKAFKNAFNIYTENRSIIIRFRRVENASSAKSNDMDQQEGDYDVQSGLMCDENGQDNELSAVHNRLDSQLDEDSPTHHLHHGLRGVNHNKSFPNDAVEVQKNNICATIQGPNAEVKSTPMSTTKPSSGSDEPIKGI